MATDTDLAKLSVQLELQTAAFEAGVKQMDRQLKKMDENTKRSARGIEKLNTSVVKLGKGFAALAGVASVGALAQQTKEALEFADAIAKTADKVGVTTNELQELRFAASQSGIETRTLDMALQRFARRMGEAAQGTGELLKTTQELGIEFQDETGRYYTTTELLVQYADAMGKAETQQEKLRLAFKAFDSEGAALVNLLGEGSEELQAFREQAVEMGLVIDGQLVRQAEVITDKFDILATQLKVGVTSAFINATAAALEFFGVFTDLGRAEAALAIAEQKVADLEKKIAEAGTVAQRNRLNKQLLDGKRQVAELRGEVDSLTASQEKNSEAAFENASAQQRLQSQVDNLLNTLNPMNELAKQLGVIDLALKQTTDPATIAALQELREQLEFGDIDVTIDDTALDNFNDKVKEFIGTLNDEANDAAEQLGIMYAALEQVTDPALRAKIEEMIEALSFGEEDLDSDPIIGYLEQIENAIDGFARDFSNTLVEGLKTGELAFDDFAKNVLETIAKMLLNDIFTQFFDVIYGGIKSYFSIGTTSAASGDTRLGTLGRVALPTEGMTRAGETSTAMVGTVVARASPKSPSSGQVVVNVNNYGNDDVEVDQRNTANGIEIDVLIKNTVRGGLADGSFDRVMASSFGARRLAY